MRLLVCLAILSLARGAPVTEQTAEVGEIEPAPNVQAAVVGERKSTPEVQAPEVAEIEPTQEVPLQDLDLPASEPEKQQKEPENRRSDEITQPIGEANDVDVSVPPTDSGEDPFDEEMFVLFSLFADPDLAVGIVKSAEEVTPTTVVVPSTTPKPLWHLEGKAVFMQWAD